MKEKYVSPFINIARINEKDILTASYDGGEIDIGGEMDNGVELPEITPPGWMNDN